MAMITLTQIQSALIKETEFTSEEILSAQFVGRIRYARIREGISQSELSRRSGVPQKTISRMENGLSMPSLSTLIKLIESMGYSINFELIKS